jgi:sugar (pentulose or hexulose) kinase
MGDPSSRGHGGGRPILSAVASGVFEDIEAASAGVRMRESVTEPDPARARRYDEPYAVFASLYPALRDAMHELGRW